MEPKSGSGEALAAISTALVQLHSRYYGKGPTKAKTRFIDDVVICLMEGGFTAAEATLLAQGSVEPVYNARQSFKRAMESEFKGVVERTLERRVVVYMSQVHHDPQLTAEIFLLGPEGDTPDSPGP